MAEMATYVLFTVHTDNNEDDTNNDNDTLIFYSIEYENIEKNMPTILHHSCDFGHVSDDIYDKLGIIQDHDKMGREVMRDASISQ